MKIFNPFKRIKQLEMQIDVLEGILEDKYRIIEELKNSLNEHGVENRNFHDKSKMDTTEHWRLL